MIEVHKTNDEIADRIQIEGIVDRNPVRDTAAASEKEGQRDVYIGFQDFQKITEYCACWAYHVFWTLYMTGMRRGEALSLAWEAVDLDTGPSSWERLRRKNVAQNVCRSIRISFPFSGRQVTRVSLPVEFSVRLQGVRQMRIL